MLENQIKRSEASFRDPDGFVFQHQGAWHRYVSFDYQEAYDHLIESGLYERLIEADLLIPHQEVTTEVPWSQRPYKILKPCHIRDMTYPYEWSFSQLKEAALTTLKIQVLALEYGMSLKDASVFNIQLYQGNPVLLDTISFIRQEPTKPWLAMGQFYRHFLWPLLAMSQVDVNLNKLYILYPDGFKLEMLKPFFGLKSWFRLSSLIHVHLHNLIANKSTSKTTSPRKDVEFKPQALKMILTQLQRLIEKLDIKQESVWKEYYQNTNYKTQAFLEKEAKVKLFIEANRGKPFIDFGANSGHFSLFAKDYSDQIYALDFDAMAVDALYRKLDANTKSKVVPLIVDLTNPTPGIGWQNEERTGILSRLPRNSAGLVLALTHHLHIANNINFHQQAAFFNKTCENLCIEFVCEDDSQVQKLLNNRYDHPKEYTQEAFEVAFSRFYEITHKHLIPDTSRILYTLTRKA